MQKTRPWLSLVIAGAVAASAPWAMAAGIGASGPGATLGQPLDFTVQIRLDAGESLPPECVSAEVTLGERRLAPSVVRTAVEVTGADQARVHVRTTMSIDEPVIGVLLQAGCTARVSRRFVVLADPPSVAAPAAMALPAAWTAPADGAAQASAAGTPEAAVAGPAAAPVVAQAIAARATPERAPRRAAARRVAEARQPARSAQARVAQPRSAQVRRVPPAAVVAAAAPRLKLETAEPVLAGPSSEAVEAALQAVMQAASAARSAAAAASAAAERIAGLERTVDGLRGEAKASRDLAAQLRERLQRAEEASRWTLPLLAVVLVLTALAAWMAWRMNAAQRVRQQAWPGVAPAPPASLPPLLAPSTMSDGTPSKQPTSPIPFVTSEPKAPEPGRPRGVPAWPPPAPVPSPLPGMEDTQPLAREPATQHPYDLAMQRTQVLPPRAEPEEPARDVSIEELIDLEQQAEFFVVLGQDEAAVDLLVEHLRHTGGSSPLPYLKLLEIFRRRGERDEYERTRSRFNLRFNAYAPDWDVDLTHGRTLDSYPGVVPRLQQVWQRPLDAMAELEALLFRKSRGDLFELPAYREVLLLYSLARDLLDREAADTGNVDLLLPLADGSEFGSTAPAPYLGLERDSGFGREEFDDRTQPVDFDLSAEHDKPTSIFDTLDPLDEPQARRR